MRLRAEGDLTRFSSRRKTGDEMVAGFPAAAVPHSNPCKLCHYPAAGPIL